MPFLKKRTRKKRISVNQSDSDNDCCQAGVDPTVPFLFFLCIRTKMKTDQHSKAQHKNRQEFIFWAAESPEDGKMFRKPTKYPPQGIIRALGQKQKNNSKSWPNPKTFTAQVSMAQERKNSQ